MRISRFFMPFAAVLMLSACANTVQNDPASHSDFSNWMNGHPSHIESWTWQNPTGYSHQNPGKPVREIVSEQGSVSTFTTDDGTTPPPVAATTTTTETATVQNDATMTPVPLSDNYGAKADEIFFLHGSSHLTPSEKGSIKSVASAIQPNTAITVIGHASHRVNGTDDPVRKKEINFEMAQKRADAVTRVLNDAGANPSMVQAISRGDDEPNPDPGARSQEAADRRVEIYTK